MLRRVSTAILAAMAAVCVMSALATRTSAQAPQSMPIAPELEGLGTLHMPVTTAVPRAQRFFDQGLRLLYAFNHAEAIRAFREAARLDPELAMAYWGQALVLGPNINALMEPNEEPLAFELVQKAAVAGCPILVGVGAPTSLAVELAADRGMTLAGFARGGSVNVYSGEERVR